MGGRGQGLSNNAGNFITAYFAEDIKTVAGIGMVKMQRFSDGLSLVFKSLVVNPGASAGGSCRRNAGYGTGDCRKNYLFTVKYLFLSLSSSFYSGYDEIIAGSE